MAVILNIIIGIALLIGALCILLYVPYGIYWGWALLFPGFGFIGKGLNSKEQRCKEK